MKLFGLINIKWLSSSIQIELPYKNIFKTKELHSKSTCAKIAQVQKEGKRKVTREIYHYNLDVIISVGYRVNSKSGTRFRIWATKTLKDHLVKGFTINKARLEQQQEKLQELQNTLEFIQYSIIKKQLSADETTGLLKIITDYTKSFILLNQYDTQTLKTTLPASQVTYEITYKEALTAISRLKSLSVKKKQPIFLAGRRMKASREFC